MNSLIEEKKQISQNPTSFDFIHFPDFAKYILDNHLSAYVLDQIRISREIDLPLLRIFSHMSDEEILEIGIPGHTEFLTHVYENRLKEYMDESLRRWKDDQLDIIAKDQIEAEDITLVSYIRKTALQKYLLHYTSDPSCIIDIIREIEYYETIAITASANVYIDILHERINEHTHFIENITNTTPGLNYVFNIEENSLIYVNKNYEEYFGYTQDEIASMGTDAFTRLIHPEDVNSAATSFKRFEKVRDGQVISWEQRVKHHSGDYKWIRNHASVFKRDAAGNPVEIAGIALDVDIEKRTAEELLRSEENLLQAQELAEMCSYEMDVATETIHASPNFLKLTGLPHGFTRAQYLDHLHPADVKMVNALVKSAIENDTVYEYEYRFYRDGVEKIFWSRGKVVKSGNKTVLRGTLMDITERKYMIQQLQRRDMLYRQAQTLATIGNWSWLITGNKISLSDELYRIYEIEDDGGTLTYDGYLSYIHPEDKQAFVSAIEHTLKTNEAYDISHRIITKRGKIKVLQAKGEVIILEHNNAVKLVGTAQDITNKYYTEQKLKENQEFIQKVANTNPSLIATHDIHTGKYTYLNNAFTKILGYKLSDVSERGIAFLLDSMHPDDVAGYIEKNATVLTDANNIYPEDGNEAIHEFKYRLKNKYGEYKWFHTYSTVFDRDESGKVAHMLNVSVDITEQEEAEQALYRKNILLQQSNANLEEYAYVASHDLKEPLRKIATFGDRLMATQYELLDDSGKVFVDKIIDSSRRMQTMISDLLSISTISGNKIFAPCDLNEVLDDVLTALEFKIEEKNAVIRAENLPVANIVVSQFRHLFQNIISNSLKFSREGVQPEISIKCQYLDPSEVSISNITLAKKYLSIQFTDNGIGFDNQYANKIFTIFQRLHAKSEYEGNGIGLAICRKIAENHGGGIFATSTLNEGATFTVIIPV